MVVVDHFYRALFGQDRDYGWFQTVMVMTSRSHVHLNILRFFTFLNCASSVVHSVQIYIYTLL